MEDCYFFLYKNCKNTNCTFRHSELARQSNELCERFANKQHCTVDCPKRHSFYHLNKRRGNEMCYWETQDRGCIKEYCEFKHIDTKRDEWKREENADLVEEEPFCNEILHIAMFSQNIRNTFIIKFHS